ncbi:unnamed protein product [Brassica rapa subsp. narinosa]
MATKNIAPSMQIQASRGTNEQSVVFGDLKPWKNTWLVHVKVLHAWKQYIQSVETMEFVLADETGQKIHATCKRTYIESKGRILTVGAWRYIRNFQITPAGGAYRTTDHTWKIVFNQNTVVTRSNHVDELYLNLSDSQSVLSGTLDENFLIDVLGQVMDCGDVENIQCTGGKQPKKLEFTLSEIKINDDDKTLTSFQSNEDSQEDNNKQVDQSGKRGQRDKWLLFPTKNIQEMITSTQVDRCFVRCTVYAIDMDWSWYYFGCKACNKRMIKTGTKVKKLNGKESQLIFGCETCKDSVFEVSPKSRTNIV